ncbi:ABC transporter permease [Conexibacter sp. CPCC 206217]|uniref:ABC transporter permease n=1 Tax=Conexibacter sp. CPCC 206217 TaxID=3064574 RepID=UPI00271E3144|nr:ABC transporter permease [Conexibacter sp. CPCC 206217]MDO8210050.1 ABC transporter permease [Conexibacter sp. CPCC 206217]
MTAAARSLARAREAALAGFIVLLVIVVAAQNGDFLSGSNLRSILLDIALIAALASAQLMVMLTRNFDLSIGSTVGLAAVTVGMICQQHGALSTPVAYLIAIAVGLVVGLLNGFLIAWLRIPSIIFTLGMLSVVRGAVYLVADGGQVNSEDVPKGLTDLSTGGLLGIPPLVLIAVAVAVAVALFLRWTRSGRSVYAVGSNPDAARLHGLPVSRTIVLVFALSGATAGLAGAMYLSRFGFAQITAGSGMELTVIAAVVVGGASIFGGSGSVAGTLLGCLLLGVIGNGFAVLGVSQYWQEAAYGALILLAVIADQRLRARRSPARSPETTTEAVA